MTVPALEPLLAPIGDDAPAGDDLEYDPEFLELDRAATPKAEQAVGDSVKEAEEPEWGKVAALAQSLLGRSKDLRIAVHLANAWLRNDGLPGFAVGLGLIHGLLENFWDGVHPQLDAEDNDDPTFRVNSVAPLNDPFRTLGYLRNTPFIQSPRLGRFSLRDLRIASGRLTPAASEADDDAATLSSLPDIEACCMDCAEEDLTTAVAAAADAFDHAQAIAAVFEQHVGVDGPELRGLFDDLAEIKSFLEPQLARRAPQESPPADADVAQEAAGSTPGDAPAAGAARTVAASDEIRGSQDVVHRLNELCKYYAKTEPSSPVPILLRRAKRLVGKNFSELLQDLAPGGSSELQTIVGQVEEDGDSGEEESYE